MPYKDKDKQREYQRTWVRQKRGSTMVRQGSTQDKVRQVVITKADSHVGASQIQTLKAIHKVVAKPEPHGCAGCKLIRRGPKGLVCPKGPAATLSRSTFEQAVNPDCNCTQEAA